MDRELLRGIISEVERELESLRELKKEMAEIGAKESIIFRRSQGSILHDFYTRCERIFKKIAADINGSFEDTEKWHKALLFRMTIPVKELRPAVISEELAAALDEYLSFRHVFRNIYGFELKGDRITHLVSKFESVIDEFDRELRRFLAYLTRELSHARSGEQK